MERGVRQVFGLIGSGNFDVTLAMVEAGASFAPSRHEGGAITMADAFGRASGEVAACSVHQGPGLTNTMTGLTEAAKSRTPLLLLAAETAASATRSASGAVVITPPSRSFKEALPPQAAPRKNRRKVSAESRPCRVAIPIRRKLVRRSKPSFR